jgi:hypothetical protein
MRCFVFESYSRTGLNLDEFKGDVNVGDLLEIKTGMMLIEPVDPVMVLAADNDKGIYEIMYLRNNYIISCGRMEIENIISKSVS